MRALHVYRTYFPDSQGGLEETIRQICVNTAPHGVKSSVLSLSSASDLSVIEREEATVYRARKVAEVASCGMSLDAFALYRKLIKEHDIVHYHYPWPFADLLHFSTKKRHPSILTYHSDIVRQRMLGRVYRPLMNRFLNSVDRIVCTSPNYFATSEVLPDYTKKVEIIPIGLNETSYPANDDQADESTQEFGENYFFFIGVLRYYKGLHILLDALKDAPYKAVIAGSGPTEQELKLQARQLKLDNVIFTGQISNRKKVSLIKGSRGIVFPSYMRSEAFGVTLLEGAMYGKPLISTEIGSGTSHVNVNGETGLVVPPGSSKALREAMDQLHFHSSQARRMGQCARARYEEHFTGELMGKRYFDVYGKLQEAAGSASVSNEPSLARGV
ncbi:MAG: glycosyltransferase [Proteobacteria bacterium]|nr:glycosyltransferase [Pseudomonadota bacterium]